jgi:hypothetical protein
MINSAESDAFFIYSADAVFKNFFKSSPSFLEINIAGIVIPAPVPSSDMITFLMSSSTLSSIMTAREPPLF